MNSRDPHSALKTEIISKAEKESVEAVLVRLSWGKHDSGYSLHVSPNSFSSAGLQTTDFLAYLGFQRYNSCPFTSSRQCYVNWVPEKFDLENFLTAFNRAFTHLEKAENKLKACGFLLDQPEGWGFFHRKPSGRSYRKPPILSGDGHTARQTNSMTQAEDDTFLFSFSFIETDYDKEFVTHYRPKHPPLSSELSIVFNYLGLKEFDECPEFDFEPCFYRTLKFQAQGDSFFDSNTEAAHRWFDAHESSFSVAIQELLSANKEIEACGFTFLPGAKPDERLRTDIEQKVIRPQESIDETLTTNDQLSNFDVAISVAGPDKQYARELAEQLEEAGYSAFYYEFYPEYLWGKDLALTFDEIFRKRSRFCVIFVSKDYCDRVWTVHELKSALARTVEEKGNEYILPIRIDDVELDGLLPTIAYLNIDTGIPKIGELLIKKLRS